MNTSQTENSLQITRAIKAPPEAIYNAWLNADQLGQWFKPDPAMTCTVSELDASVGGRYRITLHNPAKDEDYTCFGQYTELAPHTRIAFSWRWESWRDEHEASHVTIDLAETPDGTELTLTHSNLPDANAAEQHTQGWTGCLESCANSFKPL